MKSGKWIKMRLIFILNIFTFGNYFIGFANFFEFVFGI